MPPRPLSSCVRLAAHGGRTARPEKYSASAENPVRFPEDLGLDFRLSSKILRILCMPGATAARSPLDHAAIACTGTAASPAMQLGGSGRARARAPIDRSARRRRAPRRPAPGQSHYCGGPARPRAAAMLTLASSIAAAGAVSAMAAKPNILCAYIPHAAMQVTPSHPSAARLRWWWLRSSTHALSS
jgi:hypothetical protein